MSVGAITWLTVEPTVVSDVVVVEFEVVTMVEVGTVSRCGADVIIAVISSSLRINDEDEDILGGDVM